MKNIYLIALIISILLFGNSCKERIDDLEFDKSDTRLVVEGQVTSELSKQWILLSKSGDALASQPTEYISNAVVTISDGIMEYNLIENDSIHGRYETDDSIAGVPGRIYTLNIKNVDLDENNVTESYTASSKMLDMNPIDSIELERFDFGHQKGWAIKLFARDIGGRNFYAIKSYKNDTLLTDSTFEIGISDNLGFEGKYYPGLTVYQLSEDKPDEILHKGDKITLEIEAITKEYYDFLFALQREHEPKVPIFSGPSSDVPSNIISTKKTAGFFAAYKVERKSAVLK